MSSGDYIRKTFGKRFEPSGPGFLYRATERSPGIPVSAEERCALEADLDRRIRRVGLFADGRALGCAAVAAALLAGRFGASVLLQFVVGLGVLLAFVALLMRRLEGGLSQRLAGRPSVDNGFTRLEILLRNAASRSWKNLLSFLLVAVGGLTNLYFQKFDLLTRAFFTVTGALAIGVALFELGAKAWFACNATKLRTRPNAPRQPTE